MKFRPIVDAAGKFLPWIKTLCGRSGTYTIACLPEFCPLVGGEPRILYVGESHTGRLSKTLKRHFFDWRDAPERTHNVYKRHRVKVAVQLLPAGKAVAAQNRLIARLRPRDNAPLAAGAAEGSPF